MEMEPTEAQKAKAQRAQTILYIVMAILIAAPLVLFWLFGKRR